MLVGVGLVLAASGAAGGVLPLVDAHLHYSADAWAELSPAQVLALLDRAGIRRAFVSSTPDEGTVRLYRAAPDRIVPVLRPYRTREELGSWYRDPGVPKYLAARLALGIHRGIGEVHLSGDQARSPVVRAVVGLAAARGLFLHCHCDEVALETLLALDPGVVVLWAHAGMTARPAAVARWLDREPRLYVELALRADVAPGGRLDPAWRELFLRHPDRFLVGTDTWVPSRWGELEAVQAWTRGWLAELPPDVARRLAWENAERLAGGAR